MKNWKKEKPLIGTEGLIKGLHPISSTVAHTDQLICGCPTKSREMFS